MKGSESKRLKVKNGGVGMSCRFDPSIRESEKQSSDPGACGVSIVRRYSKLVIRFRGIRHEAPAVKKDETPPAVPKDADNSSAKGWNLRPRRPTCYNRWWRTEMMLKERAEKKTTKQQAALAVARRHESTAHQSIVEGTKTAEKCEKPANFSLSLSKEEIIADFIAITGSKPPKKTKKRPRSVQKELNGLLPGSDLMSTITPEMYGVGEKRQRVCL
ncbi:hypothetical protein Dimus_025135 [Dionaea muscipula]